jgi:hypothetical protein
VRTDRKRTALLEAVQQEGFSNKNLTVIANAFDTEAAVLEASSLIGAGPKLTLLLPAWGLAPRRAAAAPAVG